ncbi:hypothetical protein ColKHC_10652 [Colletotrichum higginsianum]|nr:hypothetical protein ColKHC_10652 [Colletotrichum higginsianum]
MPPFAIPASTVELRDWRPFETASAGDDRAADACSETEAAASVAGTVVFWRLGDSKDSQPPWAPQSRLRVSDMRNQKGIPSTGAQAFQSWYPRSLRILFRVRAICRVSFKRLLERI